MADSFEARELDETSRENILVWLHSYQEDYQSAGDQERLLVSLSYELTKVLDRLNALEAIIRRG